MKKKKKEQKKIVIKLGSQLLRYTKSFCKEENISLNDLICGILKELVIPEIDKLFKESEERINKNIIKAAERRTCSYWGKIQDSKLLK